MDKSTFKRKRNRNITILIMIAVASLLIRLLMDYEFDRSALLYVGIPFLITLALLYVGIPDANGSWKRNYIDITKISLIIMLGSSLILFEGFICVLGSVDLCR